MFVKVNIFGIFSFFIGFFPLLLPHFPHALPFFALFPPFPFLFSQKKARASSLGLFYFLIFSLYHLTAVGTNRQIGQPVIKVCNITVTCRQTKRLFFYANCYNSFSNRNGSHNTLLYKIEQNVYVLVFHNDHPLFRKCRPQSARYPLLTNILPPRRDYVNRLKTRRYFSAFVFNKKFCSSLLTKAES